EAAEPTLWAFQAALQAEDVRLSGSCSTSLWSAWSCPGPTRRGGLRLPGSIGAWYDPERLQSHHCCLHRQTDDVADGSRPHAHVGVVVALNGVGAGAALPGPRRQVLVELSLAQRGEGDAADFLPRDLKVPRAPPQANARPQLVLAAAE